MMSRDLAEFYYEQAENHFRLGDIEKAIKLCSEAIGITESDVYYIFRSKLHTTAAHVEESLDDANRAMSLNQGNVEAQYQRAEAYFYAGEFELALIDYQGAQQSRNNDPRDERGINKCIDCIHNATSVKSVDEYMEMLESGQIIELSLLGSSGFEFEAFREVNEQLQSESSETVTQTPEVQKEKQKVETRSTVYKNYCHVTPDKIFLEQNELPTAVQSNVENALVYINNREIFWKNQNKTTNFVFNKKVNNAKKQVSDRAEAELLQECHGSNRKIVISQPFHAESAGVLKEYIFDEQRIKTQAKNAYQSKDYNKCILIIQELEQQEESFELQFLTAKCYFELSAYDECREMLSKLTSSISSERLLNQYEQQLFVDIYALNVLIYQKEKHYHDALYALRLCRQKSIAFNDTKGLAFCQEESKAIEIQLKQESSQ